MRFNILTFDQKIKIDNTVLHFLYFIVLQIELLMSPGKFLQLQGGKKLSLSDLLDITVNCRATISRDD